MTTEPVIDIPPGYHWWFRFGALVFTVLAWKNHYWHLARRVYYTRVKLAAVAFVWFLNYWNLLGMI